jgi:hypothetical protein
MVKDGKYYEFDRKLVQETFKIFSNINIKGGVEELGMNLSTVTSKEKDLYMCVDKFTEALQSACKKSFKTIRKNKTKKIKSVPWWTDSLTIVWKRINALRRIYQRTRYNEELRESRKYKYVEEKNVSI